MKWGFLPKNDKPRYLCVNADEGEPGTYKDRLIMEQDPHQLIEACIVSSYAIGCKTCYIYIRGEFHEGIRALEKALDEAYAAGYVGKNILGTGVDVEIYAPQRRRAPTSAARRRRSSRAWRASAASRA